MLALSLRIHLTKQRYSTIVVSSLDCTGSLGRRSRISINRWRPQLVVSSCRSGGTNRISTVNTNSPFTEKVSGWFTGYRRMSGAYRPFELKTADVPTYRVDLHISVSHSFPINTWSVMDGTSMMQALMSHCSNLKELVRLPFHPVFGYGHLDGLARAQIRRYVSLSSCKWQCNSRIETCSHC